MKKSRAPKTAVPENTQRLASQADAALNHEQQQLHDWFQTVKFRKKLLGGIDEQDLWKKLAELNKLYDAALSAERARYDGMLELYKKTASASIAKYKAAAMTKTAKEQGADNQ